MRGHSHDKAKRKKRKIGQRACDRWRLGTPGYEGVGEQPLDWQLVDGNLAGCRITRKMIARPSPPQGIDKNLAHQARRLRDIAAGPLLAFVTPPR
jgi:hypothetical protein